MLVNLRQPRRPKTSRKLLHMAMDFRRVGKPVKRSGTFVVTSGVLLSPFIPLMPNSIWVDGDLPSTTVFSKNYDGGTQATIFSRTLDGGEYT